MVVVVVTALPQSTACACAHACVIKNKNAPSSRPGKASGEKERRSGISCDIIAMLKVCFSHFFVNILLRTSKFL